MRGRARGGGESRGFEEWGWRFLLYPGLECRSFITRPHRLHTLVSSPLAKNSLASYYLRDGSNISANCYEGIVDKLGTTTTTTTTTTEWKIL